MRIATIIFCLLVLATSAYADKVPGDYPNNAPLNSARQGGETAADAVAVNILPATLNGTTVGYMHDHDIDCVEEFGIGSSPDVVYSVVPCLDGNLTISTCIDPTDYDTKLGVFDANMGLVACSDDFCTSPVDYTAEISDANSEVGSVPVVAGELYYIVVSGWSSSSSGNYGLSITGMDCTTPTEVETWSAVKANY